MRIFIAGATGAVGQPIVKRLLACGHEVYGMTHSKDKASKLSALGATPIFANALDADSVFQGMKFARPEVVIDMLTSLPKKYTPQAMQQAAEQNTLIRLEGGRNLYQAAQAEGVRRYMVQSSAFWYVSGPGLATEDVPFAFNATPNISAGSKIYVELENRVLQGGDFEGVALRFGFFYGPDTWYAPDGNIAEQVQQQSFYIVEGGHGVWSFIHVDDAAEAIALALNCPPGVYNITDDTPIELSSWLPSYAHWLDAPPPLERSGVEEKRLNGVDTLYYATQLRGASNSKAKQELNFKPRPLEWISFGTKYGI